jgi:hypothetical protein
MNSQHGKPDCVYYILAEHRLQHCCCTESPSRSFHSSSRVDHCGHLARRPLTDGARSVAAFEIIRRCFNRQTADLEFECKTSTMPVFSLPRGDLNSTGSSISKRGKKQFAFRPSPIKVPESDSDTAARRVFRFLFDRHVVPLCAAAPRRAC